MQYPLPTLLTKLGSVMGLASDHNGILHYTTGSNIVYRIIQGKSNKFIELPNHYYLYSLILHDKHVYACTDGGIISINIENISNNSPIDVDISRITEFTFTDDLDRYSVGDITMGPSGTIYFTHNSGVSTANITTHKVDPYIRRDEMKYKDGPINEATVGGPVGIIYRNGSIYFTESINHSLRMVKDGIVSTIVRSDEILESNDVVNSLIDNFHLEYPCELVTIVGCIVICDAYHRLLLVNSIDQSVTILWEAPDEGSMVHITAHNGHLYFIHNDYLYTINLHYFYSRLVWLGHLKGHNQSSLALLPKDIIRVINQFI